MARATQLSRILITQDEDFLRLAAQWQAAGRDFGGVVFAPQEGASIGRYIEDLELIAHCCDQDEVKSRVHHLPLV